MSSLDPDGINLDDERVAILGEELFTALHSSKERLYILKQNELLTKFMKTEDRTIDLSTGNSYQKLILIKLAMYFNLVYSTEPSKLGVFLVKSTESAIPEKSLTDLVPSSDNNQKTNVKIMTRATPSPGAASSKSPSNANTTPHTPQEEDKGGAADKYDKSGKSLEEREQAYLEARSRIFMTDSHSTTPSTSTDIDKSDGHVEEDAVEDEPFGPDDIPRDLSRLPGYQNRGGGGGVGAASGMAGVAGDYGQYAMPYMVPNAQSHIQAQAQVQAQAQAQLQAQAQAQAAIAASSAALSAQSAPHSQFWNPWMTPNVFMPPNPALLASANAGNSDGAPLYNTGPFGFPSATSTPQYRPGSMNNYMYGGSGGSGGGGGGSGSGSGVRPGSQRPPRMARPPMRPPAFQQTQTQSQTHQRPARPMQMPYMDGLSINDGGYGGRSGLTPPPPSSLSSQSNAQPKNVNSSGMFTLDPQLVQAQKGRGGVGVNEAASADETSSNHSSSYTNGSNNNNGSRRSTRRRRGTAQSAQTQSHDDGH